jgi:hypothetical protein
LWGSTDADQVDIFPAKEITVICVTVREPMLSLGCSSAGLIDVCYRDEFGKLRQASVSYCMTSHDNARTDDPNAEG